MPTIRFRGCFIRYADLRHEDEAGKFIRLHMTSDFSDTVRQHMGWEDLPDSLTSGKLTGELTGRHLVLTPNGKELQRHELSLEVTDVSDFQVFRVKDGDSNTTKEELRFIVRSQQPGGMALIENYVERIGRGLGALKIAHEKQEGLDFGPDAEEEDASNDVEKQEVTGGALASAAEVLQKVDLPTQEKLVEMPRALAQPDADGLFDADLADKERVAGERYKAEIRTLAVEGGWAWGYFIAAAFGRQREVMQPLRADHVCAAESEAREKAARAIYRWAAAQFKTAGKVAQRPLRELMDWAIERAGNRVEFLGELSGEQAPAEEAEQVEAGA